MSRLSVNLSTTSEDYSVVIDIPTTLCTTKDLDFYLDRVNEKLRAAFSADGVRT